jgi:hypothetical protein
MSVFGRIKPGRKPGKPPPVRGHNKGPIGPLDSEPPWPWRRNDVMTVADATDLLREMGAHIGDRDIEQAIAEGTGPSHNIKSLVRTICLGDAIDWSRRHIRKDNELNRKEATEYIRSLGYQISDTALQQSPNGLPFVNRGRDTIYTKEDCREWVEKKIARGLPSGTYAPKYKPPWARRRCPCHYEHCPTVKHEDCKKYAQALCNVAHLPDRPIDPDKLLSFFEVKWIKALRSVLWPGTDHEYRGESEWLHRSQERYGARGHDPHIQWPAKRPDKSAIASYLAAWQEP